MISATGTSTIYLCPSSVSTRTRPPRPTPNNRASFSVKTIPALGKGTVSIFKLSIRLKELAKRLSCVEWPEQIVDFELNEEDFFNVNIGNRGENLFLGYYSAKGLEIILEKYKIPVVLYPTTGMLDKPVPYWFDRLDYAIQQPGLDGQQINVGHVEITIDQSSKEQLALSLSQLTKCLKDEDQSDTSFQSTVGEIIDYLEKMSGRSLVDVFEGDLWSSVMSRQDIKDCDEMDGVTVGSHTINHVRLSLAEDEVLAREVMESKSTLEDLMAGPCQHFCYPNGDWNDNSSHVVESAGYLTAVTTDPGCNEVGENLFTLKRYSFPETGTPLNALFSITGILHYISTVRYR